MTFGPFYTKTDAHGGSPGGVPPTKTLAPQHYKVMPWPGTARGGPRACTRRTRPRITIRGWGCVGRGLRAARRTPARRSAGRREPGKTSMLTSRARRRRARRAGDSVGSSGTGDAGAGAAKRGRQAGLERRGGQAMDRRLTAQPCYVGRHGGFCAMMRKGGSAIDVAVLVGELGCSMRARRGARCNMGDTRRADWSAGVPRGGFRAAVPPDGRRTSRRRRGEHRRGAPGRLRSRKRVTLEPPQHGAADGAPRAPSQP